MYNLALLKYIKSFSEGRVRIRHPALKSKKISDIAKQELEATKGISQVECNTLSGSVLILYDAAVLSKETLMEMGTGWATYLDTIKNGGDAKPPHFAI